MSTAQLERRLRALEAAIERLQNQVRGATDPLRRWWIEDAGRFKGDADFDDIVRLGKAYRESLRPKRRRGKA